MLVAFGLVALDVSACGRRGALEPPPGGAVAAARPAALRSGIGIGTATPDPSPVQDGDELSPSAVQASGLDGPVTTSRGAKRGYVIPKQPFLLDPLL